MLGSLNFLNMGGAFTRFEMNRSKKVAIISFIATFVQLSFFLHIRGTGWDGDSVTSAVQFVKLLNHSIYGLGDGGTHPKLLCIILFGALYQIFGSFIALTYFAILLNSLMAALICKWIEDADGASLIALCALTVNFVWSNIVINGDNPAFSIPFIFFGVYYYAKRREKTYAATLLLMSNLFRPGAEFILVALLCIEIWNYLKNREKFRTKDFIVILTATAIALVNTKYGYLFAYPNEEAFKSICMFGRPDEFEFKNVHGLAFIAIIIKYYSKSILMQALQSQNVIFSVLAILGLKRFIDYGNSTKYVFLLPFATLIHPIAIFLIETTPAGIHYEKHMEFALMMPVIASFAIPKLTYDRVSNLQKRYIIPMLFAISLVVAIVVWKCAASLQGLYEVNPNGSGQISFFVGLPDVRRVIKHELPNNKKFSFLISKKDVLFFVLDNGLRAKRIQFIEELDKNSFISEIPDVIMITANNFESIRWIYNEYTEFNINNRILLIKSALLLR